MPTTRSAPPPDIQAAGVVTFRPGREVLLVHRPKYDDWSFPKGKLERGEHAVAAAVREVAEETGLHVRLGPPLASQRYETGGRMKTVGYWTGRVVGDDDVSLYRPNDEIDRVEWVPVAEAPDRLTYPYDRQTLADALEVRRRTRALVVLRHGQARSRKGWRRDDALRPLVRTGAVQAEGLVPLLAAYDVTTVVSSSSTRCVQTVTPYAHTAGLDVDTTELLSEEGATPEAVTSLVEKLAATDGGAVLCSHRPVLPLLFDALGLRPKHIGAELAPAEMLVVHVRKDQVVATERHGPY